MSDVGDSVSNPQSPVNGILDEPLTLDFDPMSFQLSSPTESKPPIDLVDSSPEDPPFANETVDPPTVTNYKYNPKSYLLDLDSLQELQATMQSSSSSSYTSKYVPQENKQTPDLLVDLAEKTSGPQECILEEDEEELDLSDPKTEDDSREADLSVEASESSSSLNPDSSSLPVDAQSPTQDGPSPPLDETILPEDNPRSPIRDGTYNASPVKIVELPTFSEDAVRSPTKASKSSTEDEPCSPYQVTTPQETTATFEPEKRLTSPVIQISNFDEGSGSPVGGFQSPEYLVSSPDDEELPNLPDEDGASPLPDATTNTDPGTISSDMDTSSRTTSAETVACASPFNNAEASKSPDCFAAEEVEEPRDTVLTPNYSRPASELLSPTHPSDVVDSPEHDDSSEDEFEYIPSGSSKSSVMKTKTVTTATSKTFKEGTAMTVEKRMVTATATAQTELLKKSAYDTLNGLSDKSDKSSFSNHHEGQRESSPPEEFSVSIDRAKLQNKFNKINIDESKCFCRKCGTHVYPVERIIAEKNFYHKNCFRCKECNKLLSVDGYMSHEAEIYCKIHFKQLFQPKARFDNDAGPRRQRRHEMIIRENVPEELPPDVVRCDTKTDDGLQNLNLDLGNIRQRFESPQEYVPSVGDRSALARSESLFKRLEKYQSVVSGDRNGDAHNSDSEHEDDEDSEDPSVVKEKRTKEKVVYEGLSSLKNQWETGNVNNYREKTEETKEELAKLRKKMCLGRSESMRQVYQKAVEDANKIQAGRAELISVEGQEAKATSIKEKFEAGAVTQETDAERIERLNREKQEDLSVFSETGIAHEAKNIFKQLDAEVARQSGGPSLARSPSNRWSQSNQTATSPNEVVKSSDPVRDVEVETNELSERFKFFENYKVESKERKRFEMTPPRETKEPSPEFQVQRDPNVVRAADAPEEVMVTDTARRMRERFRELEESASREELPTGPKPLKRITPPREYTREQHEDSPEVQRDPDIVQCSYRADEDIVVEADRAKSMRARFENWDAERIAKENKKNAENEEEECLPVADTAKNLRAKFEAIKDESVRREAERPKPKVHRFVEFPGTPTSEVCSICSKKLYPMERMEVSGLRMHKNCFRCSHCSCHLRLENYTISGGKLYCGPHFKQFFIAKGNYDEGFGREKWSRSASPASRESNEEYTNGDRDHLSILDQPVTA